MKNSNNDCGHKNPFRKSSGTPLIFASAQHESVFSWLCEGVVQCRPLSLVTGETGTGKTTLMRALIDYAGAQDTGVKTKAASSFGGVVDAEQLLAYLAAQLTDNASKFADVRNADDFITATHAQFHPNDVLLAIVDEAQDLDRSALDLILQLADRAADPAVRLTIVVSGGTKLERVFNRTFADHASVWDAERRRLHCLTEQEVQAFVAAKIRQQGSSGPQFTDAALVRVHRLSSGIIRIVSNLCGSAMFLAYSRGDVTVTEEHVEEAAQAFGIKQLDPTSGSGDERRWTPTTRSPVESSGAEAVNSGETAADREFPASRAAERQTGIPSLGAVSTTPGVRKSVEQTSERQTIREGVPPREQIEQIGAEREPYWKIAADEVPSNLQLQSKRQRETRPLRMAPATMMIGLGLVVAAGLAYQAYRSGMLDGTVMAINSAGDSLTSWMGGRSAGPRVLGDSADNQSQIPEVATEEVSPRTNDLMTEIQRLRQVNDTNAALALLDERLKADPTDLQLIQLRNVLEIDLKANEERERVNVVVTNLEREARAQQTAGNYDAALITVAAALSYWPDDSGLTALRDEIAGQRQDGINAKLEASLLAAEERARRAAEVERLQVLAQSQKQTGDHEGALRSLDAAMALVTGASEVGAELQVPGDAQAGSQPEPARQAEAEMQQKAADESAHLVDQARLALADGDYATAKKRAAEALDRQPEDAELLALSAEIDTAQEHAEEQQTLAAEVEGLADEARAALAAEDYATARARAAAALDKQPGDAELLALRGDIEAAQRQADLTRLSDEARNALEAKELDTARESVELALLLAPEDPTLIELRGDIASKQRLVSEVERIGEEILRLRQDARTAVADGQYERALANVDAALEYAVDDASLLTLRSKIVERQAFEQTIALLGIEAQSAMENADQDLALQKVVAALTLVPEESDGPTPPTAVLPDRALTPYGDAAATAPAPQRALETSTVERSSAGSGEHIGAMSGSAISSAISDISSQLEIDPSQISVGMIRHVAVLVEHGYRQMRQRDVTGARLYFEAAFEAGAPQVAKLIAMTYDPLVLTQLGVVGVRGNSALARHWYQRAQDAGDPEAAERFETLHGP